jgi:hypothetical protein
MARYRYVRVRSRESDEPEQNNHDPYPNLREALAPDYADLAPEAIELLVEQLYPGADPADVEGFFDTLKKAGKAAAKFGQKALPGVISGATSGAALGPWGALAGAIGGGAMSAFSGGKGKQGPGGSTRLPSRAALAGLAKAVPGVGGALSGLASSPAAGKLLRVINTQPVGQALQALAMGGAGKQNVNIGGMSVPAAAITNALRGLFEQVETELHERTAGESNGTPLYLLGNDGEFAVDPTDEHARGERVIELLARAEAAEVAANESNGPGRYRSARAAYYREDDESADDESADDEWAEDDEVAPEDQARLLYPGVYESTARY